MGLKQILTLVPLVLPLVQGQNGADVTTAEATTDVTTTEAITDVTTTEVAETTNATEAPGGIAPEYDVEECNYWTSLMAQSDADNSTGLNEDEYHVFLTSIDTPPYIQEYFAQYPAFDELQWPFRVVHKSLSCHCEKLGYGEQCCEGDNAELLLIGLNGIDTESDVPANSQLEYKDMVCQQLSFVMARTIKSPEPTASPTVKPTMSPSGSPTPGPTAAPVTPSPTLSPVAAPFAPTSAPSVSMMPTVPEEIPRIISPPTQPPTEDTGLSTAGIIGIIIALLALILAIIALIMYRRKLERDRLAKFAGEAAPDEDLEAPAPVEEETMPDPEPEADAEEGGDDAPDEDDESSAPSVWSESEAPEDNTETEIHDGDAPIRETAGSSLAAVGAASTVVTSLMHSGNASPTAQNAIAEENADESVMS